MTVELWLEICAVWK